MTSTVPNQLADGLTFTDFYSRSGLERVDALFLQHLKDSDADLAATLKIARQNPDVLTSIQESEILLRLAPHLEDFLGFLLRIQADITTLQAQHLELAPLYRIKRLFIQRQALKRYPIIDAVTFNGEALKNNLISLIGAFDELALAKAISHWLEHEPTYTNELDLAARYAAWAVATHQPGVLFKIPHKTDPLHLIPLESTTKNDCTVLQLAKDQQRLRDGFNLTDPGLNRQEALDQANYCIWCHHQGKDSCARGLKTKPPTPERFQKNSFGTSLIGCPLEQKISEMNELKARGYTIGALAVVIIDNPMVAATGHRICNDCMKSCIYQKQEPVNIPGVETQILKDTLNLPWGFEIYSLLTRWNPLNIRRPGPLPESNHKILVVGLGPAGFTLAHHLLNEGHTVVGIDGLKIEPLPADISGVTVTGERIPFTPIHHIEDLYESLDNRVNEGFGGVAEYGITVRWDKNFLKIIRLLLERRSAFLLFGGMRFGGTLTSDQAFQLGFDHIALCMGAGSPTLINMPNGLAPGVRQASDFLMALQLTGAAQTESIANLQLRLPVAVIGGGLTAIDTATEALAYYPVQVEKFLNRYETLVKELGEEQVHTAWNAQDTEIAEEFILHAKALRHERYQAKAIGRSPDFLSLLNAWGGATLAYRRTLTQSPSYTLNHEEVAKAFEEGIALVEHAVPLRVDIDEYGHTSALVIHQNGKEITLPAKSLLIAAGTKPNTNLRYDDPNIVIEGQYFQAVDEDGLAITLEKTSKPLRPQVLMSIKPDGTALSFFGDLHPSFSGNVVKAMASAKHGYPIISRILKRRTARLAPDFLKSLNEQWRATVSAVNRLTPTIVEVVVKAPAAARAFRPGQFYRLQNFAMLSPTVLKTRLAMEGIALTGAASDPGQGLLSTIVLEMGGSSDLCATLKPEDPITLMGPTGSPTEIFADQTVLLIGGGLGNAVLFSIGKAFRNKGSRVLYVAGYRKQEDRYKIAEIEAAADAIIWCCDETPGFTPNRPQDRTFSGNIVDALIAYGRGDIKETSIALEEIDRLMVIGSDGLMAAIAKARHSVLKDYLNPKHIAMGSINSPMQCMMKEICAQCLQLHKDPLTGVETVVYSCVNQDQLLDQVDFTCLTGRLSQNAVSEKLTRLWVNQCLKASI